MQPEFEAVRADPVMGPLFENALHSPHWRLASQDSSITPEQCRLRLKKFKPSRRVCFTAEVPSKNGAKGKKFVVKVWHSTRGKAIHNRLQAIQAQIDRSEGLGFQAPEPLFYDAKAHALAYPWLVGIPLTSRLKENDDVNWIESLADAVAFLHRLSLPDLPDRIPAQEVQSVHSLLESNHHREFRSVMEKRLLEPLTESFPQPVRIVSLHRDLYDQQVLLVSPPGVALIDFDDMAKGDPMLDVGNFLAHLHLIVKWNGGRLDVPRLEEKFLHAYSEKAKIDLKDVHQSIRWYKTASLARLSALQFIRGSIDESRFLFSLARKNYFRDSQVTFKEAM